MTPDKQGPRGERGPRGPRGIRGRAVPQSLHEAEIHEDDLRVDELQQLIDDLPDKQVQFVLHKLWQIGTHGSAVAIGRVDHQVRQMIRVVTVTLMFVAVVLAFVGVLSVTSTIDQGHTAAQAKHLAVQAKQLAAQNKRLTHQLQQQRFSNIRQGCTKDNKKHKRSVAYIRNLARSQLAAAKKTGAYTPALKAEAARQVAQLDTLINDLAPRHADCAAYARGQTHLPSR